MACRYAEIISGLLGSLYFLPLFVQGVIGQSATNAGVILTPIMFGVIISSVIGGIIMSKTGRYKVLALVGLATAAGIFLLCDWVLRDVLLARDPLRKSNRGEPAA